MKLPGLKEWRELRGYTQRELATAAGVSHATIAHHELGDEIEMRPSTARRIAAALDVDITDLAGVEDRRPKASTPVLQPPLSDQDRRIVERLEGLTEHLQQRLRAGGMTREEIDAHNRNHEVIAALLGPAMRAEADELRRLFPNEPDVGPRAIIGPAVVRYVEAMIEVPDEAEKAEVIALDRESRDIYQQAS